MNIVVGLNIWEIELIAILYDFVDELLEVLAISHIILNFIPYEIVENFNVG